MAKINCLNPIAACGMDLFNDTYEVVAILQQQTRYLSEVQLCMT